MLIVALANPTNLEFQELPLPIWWRSKAGFFFFLVALLNYSFSPHVPGQVSLLTVSQY